MYEKINNRTIIVTFTYKFYNPDENKLRCCKNCTLIYKTMKVVAI